MLGKVVVENGVKKIVPLTADCGSGNPVGTVIAVYSNKVPNGYLPCNGVAFDTAQFPVLYALLQDDHTPDLRECTLKGIGESGRTVGAHVKAGGLAVGEFIDDRLQEHQHQYTSGFGEEGVAVRESGNNLVSYTKTTEALISARSGATTEVKAVGVNWCIKATSGINENQADNVLNILQPVDEVTLNNVHSVTSNAVAQKINSLDVASVGGSGKYISAISEADGKINATASNLATSVASGNTRPVTSEAVASAIVSLYEAQVRSSDLNSERHFLCSIDPATANRPTNYGVCFSFGFNTSSTDPNASRWYFQLAFSTGNEIFVRTATNPTSSSTTPDNWTSWKRIAFV